MRGAEGTAQKKCTYAQGVNTGSVKCLMDSIFTFCTDTMLKFCFIWLIASSTHDTSCIHIITSKPHTFTATMLSVCWGFSTNPLMHYKDSMHHQLRGKPLSYCIWTPRYIWAHKLWIRDATGCTWHNGAQDKIPLIGNSYIRSWHLLGPHSGRTAKAISRSDGQRRLPQPQPYRNLSPSPSFSLPVLP